MIFKIDLDKGVHSRTDPATGMEIYNYVGIPPDYRDAEPGVYRSAHGTEVGLELARRAGFDVDHGSKEKRVKDALLAARNKVLAELASTAGGEKVVKAEREGFKVVDLGYERYQVFSPEDDLLTPLHLGLHEALAVLDELAGPAQPVTPSTPVASTPTPPPTTPPAATVVEPSKA
jgi:hypothetical protein